MPASELDLVDVHLRWYDQRLKGMETGIDDEPPIKLWVMGRNEWRFENEWPPGASTLHALLPRKRRERQLRGRRRPA